MATFQQARCLESGGSQEDKSPKTIVRRMSSVCGAYCNETVQIDRFAELQLLLLTFCVGLQDGCSFPDYHCFASNQTGNTVLLAISISKIGPGELFEVKNIGVSLACFISGCFINGQFGHLEGIGQRRRIWLVCSSLVQTCMVFGAAAIQYHYGVHSKGPIAIATLALLSFASGAQVTLSRTFACTEISTAMATAAWVDLMLDPQLWQRRNRARDRRMMFLGTLFVGAVIAGTMYAHDQTATALLLSAILKAIVTGMFFFSKKEIPPDSDIPAT